MTSLPHTHKLSAILPKPRKFERFPAQKTCVAGSVFAISENAGSLAPVACGPVPVLTVMSKYRYPSLIGRSGVPKARPSAFSRNGLSARRFVACDARSRIHFGAGRGILRSGIHRGVTERCSKQKSSPWQYLHLAGLRPAVTRLANRPLWAALPGSVQPQSPMATSAPARSSARRPMSHIVRRTPAPAGRSADLTSASDWSDATEISNFNFAKPCGSCAVTGFLRATKAPLDRGQEPGRN